MFGSSARSSGEMARFQGSVLLLVVVALTPIVCMVDDHSVTELSRDEAMDKDH